MKVNGGLLARGERWPNWTIGAFLLLGGCAASSKPALPQPPPTQPVFSWATASEDNARRLHSLDAEAAALSDDAKQLPGADAADHSRIMQRFFDELLKTLPLLSSPEADRIMAQRLTIIQNSKAQLATASPDLAIEPAIETGLRAAAAALSDVSHVEAFEGADVGELLDKLSASLTRMERDRDANLHRVDVADAADIVSQIVGKLAASLGGKLTAGPAATAPATTSPAGK